MEEIGFQATYTVRLRDILLLQVYAMFFTKAALRTYLMFSGFIFAFLLFEFGFGDRLRITVVAAISLVGAAGGMVAGAVVSMLLSLFVANHKTGVLGTHELALTEEGVFEKTQANESLHRWPSISAVTCSRNYLLIQINAYLYHIVPKKTFESQHRFEEFSESARQRWRLHLTMR